MKYTVGELAKIIDGDRGKNYPKQNEFYKDGYCLFLNTGNITRNGFDFDNLQFISSEKDAILHKGCLTRGDIVYTTRGTVGNAAYYSSDIPFDHIRINSGMVILQCNTKIVDTRFLYQLLKHDNYRIYFKQYCTGSAQPQLPIKDLSKIVLDIPPLETQHRIADILSAYDDLIENNQKQIKLLEEAAQRLYKEWFVDLHFPGYEHTPIVDGVPEGWHKGLLQEIAAFTRGKTITKSQVTEGKVPVIAGGLEPAYYHNVSNTKAPVITVSGSGANAGFMRLYHTPVFASDCSFADEDRTKYIEFVYCYLSANAAKLNSLQKGAAQPHVYAKDINALELSIPNDDTLKKFRTSSKTVFLKIGLLKKQNILLQEARDRLLPKLMSGEKEV